MARVKSDCIEIRRQISLITLILCFDFRCAGETQTTKIEIMMVYSQLLCSVAIHYLQYSRSELYCRFVS